MKRLIALLVALLLLGGQAVVEPVGAGAAPAKSAKAKKAKKKKNKKKKAKRKAAAKGEQGPAGPAGPPGPPGTSVVTRVRLAAPMTIDRNDMTPVPVTGGKWTQQPGESDDFVGEVTVTLPAECTVEGPGPTDDPLWWLEDQVYGAEYFGGGWVELKLGKDTLGYADFPVWPDEAGKTITRGLQIDRGLMEPDTPTERELTVEFGRYCEGEGQSFKLESVKINVVGIR